MYDHKNVEEEKDIKAFRLPPQIRCDVCLPLLNLVLEQLSARSNRLRIFSVNVLLQRSHSATDRTEAERCRLLVPRDNRSHIVQSSSLHCWKLCSDKTSSSSDHCAALLSLVHYRACCDFCTFHWSWLKLKKNFPKSVLRARSSVYCLYTHIFVVCFSSQTMSPKLHEFTVVLRRDGPDTPWGIRLVGGNDLDTPLIITRVITRLSTQMKVSKINSVQFFSHAIIM